MPKDDIQATFPARARAAKKKAKKAIKSDVGAGGGPMTVKERGGHQTAIKAADRVLKRMGQGDKPASRSAATQPGKPKAGAVLDGVRALYSLPGRLKSNLEGVKKKTEK